MIKRGEGAGGGGGSFTAQGRTEGHDDSSQTAENFPGQAVGALL